MAASKVYTRAAILLGLALLSCVAEGRGRGPLGMIFNVQSFGAKPDGKTDSTEAFRKAWETVCAFNGKARLLIPRGEYLVGQIIFHGPCNNPMVILLKGTVKATTDTSGWKEAEWLAFEDIRGLSLNGGGTFDGQGQAVWGNKECSDSAKCPSRSVNMKFRNITDGRIGRITSLNPKGFHMCVNNCHNLKATRMQLLAPGDSPNTDGIHISSSSNVQITQSLISTGDDCISIIQGDTNIVVSDVTCGPGHGISVGSLGKYKNEKDVHGVFVRNCTLRNTENGVRVKTWRGSPPSAASNINFDDIVMENVKNPIIIDQEYCAEGDSCRGNVASRVRLSNINFRNIRGTSRSKNAVRMRCSSEFPCENVQTYNIDLKYLGTSAQPVPALSECANIKVAAGGVQNPPPCMLMTNS